MERNEYNVLSIHGHNEIGWYRKVISLSESTYIILSINAEHNTFDSIQLIMLDVIEYS